MAPQSVQRRATADAKQRCQRSVIGWMYIYYPEILLASEGKLSRWSRLHFQSLAPTPFLRRVNVRQVKFGKIVAEFLSQHDEKHVVPTPLSSGKG
jgi:hypothetical protein